MITGDFETKSYADLSKVGAWAYSEDPTTEIICFHYAFDDEEPESWWPGKYETDDCPPRLSRAIRGGEIFEAHNLAFELAHWFNIMVKRYRWPRLRLSQCRDTMAVAAYYAMPHALDPLLRSLGWGGKNPEGKRLISKYSCLYLKTAKPHIPDHEWVPWKEMTQTERKANPNAKAEGGYYNEDFSKWNEYCSDDVKDERDVSNYLGDLPDRELPTFMLDLRSGTRGLYLDLAGIADASAIVEERCRDYEQQFRELTGGINHSQREKVLAWSREEGFALENYQAEYLQELLDDGKIPHNCPVLRAVELRLAINKASTAKLDAMARQVGSDGRCRFQTRYHGAVTGRPTGTGFQPLNLNRGFQEYDRLTPEQLVRDISYRNPRWLDRLYGDAMDAVAKATRHWIMAEDGNVITSGDFSSIEARVLACLAGEEWKIEAFRNDALIYELMADAIYNLPEGTVTKKTHPLERQDGKTGELAFGFGGALGAWRKFDTSDRHTDEAVIIFCKGWRGRHPFTVDFWYDLERAAIDCVRTGERTRVRDIQFELVDEWLTMILPDGKRLWYREPELRLKMPQWHKPEEFEDCAQGKCDCEPKIALSYMSYKNRQWRRTFTYGGKLAENATQATARQIMEAAKLRVDRRWRPEMPVNPITFERDTPIILSVYDEVVCEAPKGMIDIEEFRQLMLEPAGEWCADWPISVGRKDVWQGERYRK